MNLFFARLAGKIKTAEQFEKYVAQLVESNKRYRLVEQSAELKEYQELKAIVESSRFQDTKREYQTKKYKDTVEYKNYRDFLKVKKDKLVKKYLQAATEEERDSVKGAISVKHYLQLKSIVEAPAFETNRLFWADKNRWKQTEEYRTESRYEELKKSADIQFFLSADKKLIEEVEQWEASLHTAFSKGDLQSNGLTAGFYMKTPSLRKDFSLSEEAQAYCGEDNINILGNVFSILTERKDVESPVWDSKIGFRPQTFHYTSAVAHTAGFFAQSEGIFSVKVKASGKCHSAVCLMGEDGRSLIELFHYNGKGSILVGTAAKGTKEEVTIKGMPANVWNVLTAIVNRKQIVFLLNGKEVLTTSNPLIGQNLYFELKSFAPAKKGGIGRMDVAWLRAYTRK